ncbi:dipeptidase PepV [Bacillus songklensis]|uniref:Dipeptidase PepV n=1 Tax=Bacillus songklensis TaxID=1069116 RepID=A0ABV8B0C1_9BACI
MENINWLNEVEKRKEQLIQDTQQFLQIKSVLDESTKTKEMPFGEGIHRALTHLLQLGEKDGFKTKNVDGYAGHIEMGSGKELIGILCHVDVVPEGDGWSTNPYGAEIKDGNIYARGAIDDKGPTMAAYYAMKIVKELNLPLNKRVRIILGTDEESSWQCVDHYFKHEEMPIMGFAPDADFPIIYAEKGIADFDLIQNSSLSTEGTIVLKTFQSGRRYNMVPDFAEAILVVNDSSVDLSSSFETFLQERELQGKVNVEGQLVTLKLEGVSAHGSVPELGENAGLILSQFLHTLPLDEQAKEFIGYVYQYFVGDTTGEKLNVNYSDDITGKLTINVGILHYDKTKGGKIGVNTRYPVTANIEKTIDTIRQMSAAYHMNVENVSDSKPHHVEQDHELIKTLQKVYTEQTGEEATLLSIGGGTYARSLKAGVAFGPLFPGREELAHQKDEYIMIEDMLKAAAIYAQAIYELAK